MTRLIGLFLAGACLPAMSFAAKLEVTTNAVPSGTIGVSYSQTLSATGGTGGYSWSLSAGALPLGLSVAASGSISGTPTTAGTATFTVQVTDSSHATATAPLSITTTSPLTITTSSLPNGAVGEGFSQVVAASGGTGGYTWSRTAGALPGGLTLAPSGTISGTPMTAGTANFTVQVKDSSNATTTQPLSITVNPALTVSTSSLPNGTMGTGYSQTLTANGGTGGYSWSTSVGSLPSGLTLAAGGGITGTPTAAGTANFTVQVKDSSNATATKALSITIAPPLLTVTTSSLPNGTMGTGYSQTLTANGGTGGYSWSTSVGSLPSGLTLAAGGGITGTPTATGTANFTVQVKDSSNATATKALSITIAPPLLTVTTSSLPNGTVGTGYSQTLTASGGAGGYSWSTSAGSLPSGLTLAAGGGITGTPTAAGTANFTVQVKDSSNATATQALSITIAPPLLTVTTSSLPNGTVGTGYSQTLTASGGTGGYSWSTSAGSLPSGLTLAAGGGITGTPTAAGAANFTVQVKDSSNATATQALSITIAPPTLAITTSSLPNGTMGTGYSQTLTASGGAGGYSWSTSAGSLPSGLTLAAGGGITGTPTAAGAANFTVQVKDSSNATATQALSITIAPPLLTVTTSSLPNGTMGTGYSQTLTASGGTGGYSWSTSAGSLPSGLTLAAGGGITGTPTAAGAANFTVQVKDSSNATATQALSITIAPPTLAITTSSLPNGTMGTGYSQTLTASGGAGGYSWSTSAGSLPSGLTLAAGGGITGTPTAAGAANFTVQVKDSSNATATQALSITIAPPTLAITTSSLPNGTVGTGYSQTLTASGGAGGYSWSTSAGSLPSGLTLAAGGGITGTPTAAGTASFTVQVKDSSNATATKTLTITIAPRQLTIITLSLSNGIVGTVYSQPLAASGGTGSYTWSLSGGNLPGGLGLVPGGSIAGTPTAAGSFTFSVSVTDGSSTATHSFTLSIVAALVITSSSIANGKVGVSYSDAIRVSGGTPPYAWTVGAGQLPTGLLLDPQTGAISGTPTVSGPFAFTIQVTDSASARAETGFTVTIGAALAITTTASLATGSAGTSYSQTFTATGGTPPYSWSESGNLPAGLNLSLSGVLTGTPTQVGDFPIVVQVIDASSAKATANYSLQVVAGLAISTPPVLAPATEGVPYNSALQAIGGSPPYSWTATAGSLPAGLSFSGSGQISGTATAIGDFTFTAQVTDLNSHTAQKQFTISVKAPLSITSAALPAGNTGTLYSQTLTATGGTPPYNWAVTAGSAPNGLALEASTGAVVGTPTATGTFTFTVTVADANSATAQQQFTISIGVGLTFTTLASLPAATAGVSYNVPLQASGGTPPYSWSVAQGSLPSGLSLNGATGVIGGVPAAAGTFNFTIGLSDSGKLSATNLYTIVVGLPGPPTVSISGTSDNLQPLQQPPISVSLGNSYPVPINGVLGLTFTPSGANAVDDPSVQFSTGGRSANFTIPAGATQAVFGGSQFALQVGTVTGNITLKIVSLQAGGTALTVPSGATQTMSIAPAPPVIGTILLVHTSDGVQLQMVGAANTRDLTQATVTFQPQAGTSLQTSQLSVPLSQVATAWFSSTVSANYGGQFALTLPFTFSGSVSLSSVSVVLSSSAGVSQPASANY